MNERIKELAARSNFGHMENGEVVYDHRLEKFAELIVRECADLVDTLNEAYEAPSTAGKFIKNHFGVDEEGAAATFSISNGKLVTLPMRLSN